MQPKQIKIKEKENLLIKWDDDSETMLSLKYMRDECPCAGCKGETILLRTYRPPKPRILSPDMYKVKSINVVGGYAIQIAWKDGHETGIYSWEYIRQLENDQAENKSQNYKPLL
jgi:DUF971 family protein